MKLNENELRDIIKSTIKESLFGLSFDNFAKNGHFHENSKSSNPVIQAAWRNGWELMKDDGDESKVEGVYQARIMSGAFNNIDTDPDPRGVKHPKVSWPMLIALLNKQFRGTGYIVKASNYREGTENLIGNEDPNGGAKTVRGTITVLRG